MKTPTRDDFRAAGYTEAAADHPLDEKAVRLLCAFNGIEFGQEPPAWWYAPNESVRDAWRRVAAAC